MKKILTLLTLVALFIFNGCGQKNPNTKYISNTCPKLQEFKEMNASIRQLALNVNEVNETIQSMEAVTANVYREYWLTPKKQIKELMLYVKSIKGNLLDSLTINALYKEQIDEYNRKYTTKGNAWNIKKE